MIGRFFSMMRCSYHLDRAFGWGRFWSVVRCPFAACGFEMTVEPGQRYGVKER